MDSNGKMDRKTWLFAGALGVLAAVVYFTSVAQCAFPGESAHLMAVWKGLVSDPKAGYPLLRFFAHKFGSGNLIAPVCGVVSCVSLFVLLASFVARRVRHEELELRRTAMARIAAVAGTLVFMFSPAVRAAASHLSPRMFDFTWALVSFALAVPLFQCEPTEERSARWAAWLLPAVLGVMAGLGLCDSVLFLAFLPFYVLMTVAQAKRLDVKFYFALLVLLATAAVTFLVAVNGFGLVMADHVSTLAAEAKDYWAHPGWFFVALFSTLPFVVALFSSDRAFEEAPGPVQWMFHGALSFVVILAVATPLSPAKLMEPFGIEPVATSAFVAAVAGYLAAYWWANRVVAVGLAVGAVLAFVLGVSLVWSAFSFDADSGAFADRVARKVVEDLGTRTWLVTDGLIDDHVKLVAEEMGKKVNLISLARDLESGYQEELSALVEKEGVGGSRNGALRISLSLGVLPFVQDWFASDPSVAKEVAVFSAPDLWAAANVSPVPEFLFFGGDPKVEPDWSCWKEFDEILSAPKDWGSYHDRNVSNPVDRLRYSLRRHLGFVANNRGVYLQDQKKDDAGFAMYELVLGSIDRDNICAVFNEMAMASQGHAGAMTRKRELEQLLKQAIADKGRRYVRWSLGSFYGYVRDPDMFVRLGYDWARSGRPGEALSQIRRAIDFVPAERRTGLLNMMASLYANENSQQKSREIFESVLANDEHDHDALVGLMRLELMNGNTAKALEYLLRASKCASDGRRGLIEQAIAAMMQNDLGLAKQMLKKLTDEDADDMQPWSLLAAVTMQQIDATKDEKEKAALMNELETSIVPEMERRAGDSLDYYLQTTKGYVALRKGAEGRQAARDAFLKASKTRPDVSSTQDMVLELDISMNDRENAEAYAKEILRRNRNAPLANYVLGSIALGEGKYGEAEVFLRRAADAPQPVPLALNDLAEVLRRNRNFDEAELYARRATKVAPNLYQAWDTLGAVLMDAGKQLDEAEACVRTACTLSRDQNGRERDVRMLISLARVQAMRKDALHAKVTIRKIRARIDELSDFEKAEFEAFAKDVR